MKKLMYFLLIVLSFGLTSCIEIETGLFDEIEKDIFDEIEKDVVEEDIVGHTFAGYDKDNYMKLTFRQDKICLLESTGGHEVVTDALTYTITNTDVRIYFDMSDTWKESSRGQIYLQGTYDSKNKEMTLSSPTSRAVVVLKQIN